jgi:hypothetical protein
MLEVSVFILEEGNHNSGGFVVVCHFCYNQNEFTRISASDSSGYGAYFTSNKLLVISIVYCVVYV